MTGPFLNVPLEVVLGQAEDDLSLSDSLDRFAKFYLSGMSEVLKLIANKKILPRDVAVLIAMASEMQIRSGRTRMRASKIADLLNVSQNHVQASIKRLRQAQLIVKTTDNRTHEVVYLISPYLFAGGSEKQRGLQTRVFHEAIIAEDPRFADLSFTDNDR